VLSRTFLLAASACCLFPLPPRIPFLSSPHIAPPPIRSAWSACQPLRSSRALLSRLFAVVQPCLSSCTDTSTCTVAATTRPRHHTRSGNAHKDVPINNPAHGEPSRHFVALQTQPQLPDQTFNLISSRLYLLQISGGTFQHIPKLLAADLIQTSRTSSNTRSGQAFKGTWRFAQLFYS
jgi:hypothetical protein